MKKGNAADVRVFAANVFASPTCWGFLGSGASYDEILTDYPFLEQEDILAAIDYAAHQTDHIVIEAS